MSALDTDSEVIYPNCRCVDSSKPLCFYCEDTEVEEEEEGNEEEDNSKPSSNSD